MKKISILMTSFLVITLSLLTSCDNDHYGPTPVDVTANYSNKLSNPNPNLILTYNGETMIGKSVDFSTVTGETAIVTLYDILPGEKELKMVSIPLSGDEEGYSFSGNGMGENTLTSFRYEGRVTKGQLTLNISNLQMGNAELWANTYKLPTVINGIKRIVVGDIWGDEYTWQEVDGQVLNASCYFYADIEASESGATTQTWGNAIQNILSYILPQVLQDITLRADGNITASYSNEPLSGLDMETIFGFLSVPLTQDMITPHIANRKYIPSPKGFANWHQKNDKFILKLNLANIISQIASDKHIDANIINAIIDAISQMDPMKLKELLTTLNQSLNNDTLGFLININDTSFKALFNWLTTGIPMLVTSKEGHTHIYLDKEEFTPIAKLLPDLSPLVISMLPEDMQALGSIISAFLDGISKAFLSPQKIEFGLELVQSNKK